jgi:hypothetical protein
VEGKETEVKRFEKAESPLSRCPARCCIVLLKAGTLDFVGICISFFFPGLQPYVKHKSDFHGTKVAKSIYMQRIVLSAEF